MAAAAPTLYYPATSTEIYTTDLTTVPIRVKTGSDSVQCSIGVYNSSTGWKFMYDLQWFSCSANQMYRPQLNTIYKGATTAGTVIGIQVWVKNSSGQEATSGYRTITLQTIEGAVSANTVISRTKLLNLYHACKQTNKYYTGSNPSDDPFNSNHMLYANEWNTLLCDKVKNTTAKVTAGSSSVTATTYNTLRTWILNGSYNSSLCAY